MDLRVQIGRDSLDKRERPADRIRANTKFFVDMEENSNNSILDLLKTSRRKQFIEWEIAHELIVFLYYLPIE